MARTLYWAVSIFFHLVDVYDLFPQYRLHTPEEITKRNRVSRYEVARDVIIQQVIQVATGAVLALTEPPQMTGKADYDVAVWATRLRLAQRGLPALLGLVGLNATAISKNVARPCLLHFHVVNPGTASFELLNGMLQTSGVPVAYSYEETDLSSLTSDQRKVYYSCARFLVLSDLLQHYGCSLLVTDADQLVIKDPSNADRAGKIEPAFTESVDVMPTILDWLGGEAPVACDGRSLLRLARGDAPADWRTELHYEYDFRDVHYSEPEAVLGLGMDESSLCVVQDERHKYVHFAALPPLEECCADAMTTALQSF